MCIRDRDHTVANSNSFDLTKADFEWYDVSSNPSFEDTDTEVPNLEKIYCYTATIWGPHNRGFTSFALARLGDDENNQLSKEDYLKDYPDSRLIVIDTLQKVRTASKDNAYASDYGDISLIKDFADRHSLAVIVVHHIRKQNDSDVFNKVSGTTGLTGSADATFVLEKETRASDTARLYCVGRDIEYQEFTLRFQSCSWELVERKGQRQMIEESIPPVLFRVVSFMQGKVKWSGTATELLSEMAETDTAPNVITKLLNEYRTTFLKENGLAYNHHRTKAGRNIILSRG